MAISEMRNISGTAERISAKFTRKTCLVPRSDEFEGHGQRWTAGIVGAGSRQTDRQTYCVSEWSRSPGTKTAFFGPFGGLHAVDVW